MGVILDTDKNTAIAKSAATAIATSLCVNDIHCATRALGHMASQSFTYFFTNRRKLSVLVNPP